MDINVDAVVAWVSIYSIKIIGALLIFIIGKWLARRIANLLGKLMTKNNVDQAVVGFLTNLSYYALLVVVIIAAIGKLGVNTTSFLAIVGAAGLAIGLALKDSLSNFAAGVMLVMFRPFTVGDVVSTAGITAKVEKITIFNTLFCTADNQLVIKLSAILSLTLMPRIPAELTWWWASATAMIWHRRRKFWKDWQEMTTAYLLTRQ